MPDGNVKSLEKESFRKRLAILAQAGSVADSDFADAVYKAVAAHGVAEGAFRDTFGLSGGTVERWTMQKSLPQPAVRGKILSWIATQV